MERVTTRISDVVPEDITEILRIEDLADGDWLLLDFEFRDGQFGEYAVLTVSDTADGNVCQASTGAKPIMRQLKALDKEQHLPLLVRAEKVGRTWRLI